jgi:serine/threonine-protein kinase
MRLGQYTLDSKIGEGGNGAVYRAHHALLRRPTAVKVIRPDKVDAETLDRFEREVQHMSLLSHPNTVAVFDYGRSPEGNLYYAMEFLDGIDLDKLVQAYGPQSADRAIAILVQVCGALQEAHNRALIHRDIKPANIILCERGDVPDVAKVVDFGLVKEITADRADFDKTGRIFGTPSYVAPECITDPEKLGPPADIYGLGAVGYFLITGRCVFEGKTALDVCLQHVTAKPVPPSQLAVGIPPELEAVILRCLAKDPKDRPASAGELARLLRAIPSSTTWSEAEAAAWWSKYKAQPVTSHNSATLTITVDLDARNDNVDEQRVISRRA